MSFISTSAFSANTPTLSFPVKIILPKVFNSALAPSFTYIPVELSAPKFIVPPFETVFPVPEANIPMCVESFMFIVLLLIIFPAEVYIPIAPVFPDNRFIVPALVAVLFKLPFFRYIPTPSFPISSWLFETKLRFST